MWRGCSGRYIAAHAMVSHNKGLLISPVNPTDRVSPIPSLDIVSQMGHLLINETPFCLVVYFIPEVLCNIITTDVHQPCSEPHTDTHTHTHTLSHVFGQFLMNFIFIFQRRMVSILCGMRVVSLNC